MALQLVDPAVAVNADPGTSGESFTDWPFELGRIEERHGLTFVHPSASGRFRVADYRRIPGSSRIELWDGIAVVYPELDRRSSSLLKYFYELLREKNPDSIPLIGPMDMVVGRNTVFAPDLVLLPKAAGPPSLVADIRRNCRSSVLRARLRGYAHAGVGAHWAIDPDALTLTVHELDCRGGETAWRLMDETSTAWSRTDDPPPTAASGLPVRTPGTVPAAHLEFQDDLKVLTRVATRLKAL